MNYLRTAMLLAAMTALFLVVGFMLGGEIGIVVAPVVALGMNAFAYWNSDRLVLRMYGAREVDRKSAPALYGIVQQLAVNAGAISMLASFGWLFGGNRNNPLGFVGVLLMMFLVPMAAGLVQMAISRSREY